MILQIFITRNKSKKVKVKRQGFLATFCFFLIAFAFALVTTASAQRVAVISPDGTESSSDFAGKLEAGLSGKLRVIDYLMSNAAFASVRTDNPFNITTETSKAVGSAMGCDFFILVRSDILRRSSSSKNKYFEAYAAVYVISSRTGRLVFWELPGFGSVKLEDAQNALMNSARHSAALIVDKLKAISKSELAEPPVASMEEPPAEGSPLAKNFRSPVPYRRIKPEYTSTASLYDIKATVDIMVDLNAQGAILRTEIVRWAGYGLDESVEKAVRAMNWRPAERNGKALPMRFLLRYNFKKIDKE